MKLQAFIFCGKGNELVPFSNPASILNPTDIENLNTANPSTASKKSDGSAFISGDNPRLPKALLPVANRPMIEYVIDWCDQANFYEINIVAHINEINLIKNGLSQFLSLRNEQFNLISKSVSTGNNSNELNLLPKQINFIPTNFTSTTEIVAIDLLDKIKYDFVLLPSDFITDIPPQLFINQFANRDDDNLAMTVYYKHSMEFTVDKKQNDKNQFFTVYSDPKNGSKNPVLLDIYSKQDVSKTKYLQIRSHLLWKYPNSTVSTKLINSSIYFCSFELTQLLSKKIEDEENAIEEDDDNDAEEGIVDNKEEQAKIHPSYFSKQLNRKLIKDHINTKNSTLSKLFRDLSRRSWQHCKLPRETISIFIIPQSTSFIRCNNLNALMDATRFILKIKSNLISVSNSLIGNDSIVDPSSQIMERSSIKLSAVGNNCKIGSKCRISGSIILNDAEIDDECILENVIIGPNAKINKKSKLTNCYVEGNYVVEAKSMLKGETLSKLYLNDELEDEHTLDDVSYDDEDEDTDEESDSEDSYEDNYFDDNEYEDDGLFER
ncbi:hypothetical protein KAFR_0A04020 [Kazachstania africana CBS 2517]|uniref:Translation initiation factor eIF2B subunit gamma n=1 Tax=Kazachstania africana (strain ATCC 22294 / BCRC 22015 / CBS 2517 / CECT 1963 / NBRC 1671 / NRRL Y-8276) TaxID=1071382 RepID=H2AN87_KAZAF|nr:hypothetical protein KAFR_0A04020 [Kazachstania africana CBS 2517]CCF55837.1 hypothetical protein KAFR_0A04020 [Kazachstania africana CBS 2517]